MFLNKHNHKNTAKFFLFFGFSLQKWSEKNKGRIKIYLITPFYLPL